MKKFLCTFSIFALMAMMVGFTSCKNDSSKDEPSNEVKVINNSNTTLYSFTIVFENEYEENLDKKNFGDFAHGETHSMTIPVGASRWYCATLSNGSYYFSPYYNITTIKELTITQSTLNQWTTN